MTELEKGKTYTIKRITGKILTFQLIEYFPATKALLMQEVTHKGQMLIDNLSEAELESIQEVKI